METQSIFNLECLHPVACVRSGDWGFYITYITNIQLIRCQLSNPS
jgi:hypothetical protein